MKEWNKIRTQMPKVDNRNIDRGILKWEYNSKKYQEKFEQPNMEPNQNQQQK